MNLSLVECVFDEFEWYNEGWDDVWGIWDVEDERYCENWDFWKTVWCQPIACVLFFFGVFKRKFD